MAMLPACTHTHIHAHAHTCARTHPRTQTSTTHHFKMYLVPIKVAIDMKEFTADNRFTTNVALSPFQAYSSSAIGVSNL